LRKILSPGTIFARAVCIRIAIKKYREATEISDEDVRPDRKKHFDHLKVLSESGRTHFPDEP